MQTTPDRIRILECPIDAVTFTQASQRIVNALESGTRLHVGVCNVDMVMKTRSLTEFRNIFEACGLIICDGVPLTWAAGWLGTPLKGRVSGTELVWECANISAQTGKTIALIGAEFEITQRAAETMTGRYPGAKLHPFPTPYPLTDEENNALLESIRGVGAHMVLVALGAPKQERWIRDHLDGSGAFVGMGIGSAFDIISGDKPRAPQWMCDYGLEWLYRMFQDPSRLVRRYLVDDLPFFWHVAVEALQRRLGPDEKH